MKIVNGQQAVDFLMDEQMKVRKAHYGKYLNDHIPIEEIKSFAGLEQK